MNRNVKKNGRVIDQYGAELWYHDDMMHRLGGPAYISPDGYEEWWLNGQIHRDDGPAITEASGTRIWYQFDEKHRDDGPAMIRSNGAMEWWKNGKLHRDDGPAIITASGNRGWFLYGKLLPIVLTTVRGRDMIFTEKYVDMARYPSWQHDRTIGGFYLSDVDLTLFMLQNDVTVMPYE